MKEEIINKYFPCDEECDCEQTIKKSEFSQSLDQYADWKIRECLPEKDNDVDGFIRDFRRGFNYCIDQILLSIKKNEDLR